MSDRSVTETECALRTKNIEQSLGRIEEGVSSVAEELKEFKGLLNPAFNTVKQDLAGHLVQNGQEKQRHRDKWSPWQLAITAIIAAAAIGMFIVSVLK